MTVAGHAQINMNARLILKDRIRKYEAELSNMHSDRYWVETNLGFVDEVLVHEFGHVVQEHIEDEYGDGEPNNFPDLMQDLGAAIWQQHGQPATGDWLHDLFGWHKAVVAELGQYAATSSTIKDKPGKKNQKSHLPGEFFPELFLKYWSGAQSPATARLAQALFDDW